MFVVDVSIEALDFATPELACEYSGHKRKHPVDAPASVMMRVQCPGCGVPAQFLMCLPGYSRYVAGDIVHPLVSCGGVFPGRQWVVGVLPV